MTNVNGIESVEGVIETMLNAEMAETTPTPDIFINTTEEVIKVAAGSIVDTSTVTDYFSNTFGGFTLSALTNKCGQWQEPYHVYFQLANALFLIAFLSPHKSYGFLLARCALVCGSILMTLWSYLIECSLDALAWNGVFVIVNLAYLFVLMYQMRPVYFEKEIDEVYVALFKPLKVSRHQFKKILNCMKMIRSLKYQEIYAQEKVTKVDSLSLVLSGKLVVSQNQRALHIVFQHQFLDSPEWFGVSTDDYFQVSIMAMEESRVLIWHRDKLRLSIINESFLQTVFDHILGKDVVKKLMQVTQVSETLSNSNGHIQTYDESSSEDKPMLQVKMNGADDQGINALINRQLQVGDINSWRLGCIEETDHETAV
ncbi:blood vessel epicardial substance isoform X4 [Sitodiplosis mosellana]|uniref:blood vessel epicardial substance isoform X4 n=1 Tax=Sitodiplosis mosellana TaxID=263140 RepID=UPI002443C5FC|nr:blood vessel epicardial substance isoform X4 [Sitodiplosis mosellana]XP_055298132.1 blood vessel epicardial substance isoform X4 [Sitodiplosis mosellana]XP_055298133.1 blood vessel epicardial substance isoform X4 [Sitodiplosis mosellana]